MKAVAGMVAALGIWVCVEARAETPVKGSAAPVQKAAPIPVKKDTEAGKAEAVWKKNLERIQKRQEVKDSLNAAIVETLKADAQRASQKRKSKKTAGGIPQVSPSAGKTPKK